MSRCLLKQILIRSLRSLTLLAVLGLRPSRPHRWPLPQWQRKRAQFQRRRQCRLTRRQATAAHRRRRFRQYDPRRHKRDAMVETIASPGAPGSRRGESVRGGSIDESQPEKKGRFNFTPEEMGLMTFGLTLLAGGGVNAVQNGLSTHSQFDAIRDRKEQKQAKNFWRRCRRNISPQSRRWSPRVASTKPRSPPRSLNARTLFARDKQQRVALAGRVADMYGISSAALENMSADRLAQMAVNFADADNQHDCCKSVQQRGSNGAG